MHTETKFEAAASPGQRPAQGNDTGVAASLSQGPAMPNNELMAELPPPRVYRAAEGPMLEYFERGQRGPVAHTVRIARLTCEVQDAELVYTLIDRLLTRLDCEKSAGRAMAMAFDQALRRAQNAEAAMELLSEKATVCTPVKPAPQEAFEHAIAEALDGRIEHLSPGSYQSQLIEDVATMSAECSMRGQELQGLRETMEVFQGVSSDEALLTATRHALEHLAAGRNNHAQNLLRDTLRAATRGKTTEAARGA